MNDDNVDGVLLVYEEIFCILKLNSYCIMFYGWMVIVEFLEVWVNVGF